MCRNVMAIRVILLALAGVASLSASAEKVRFDNYRVISVKVENEGQKQLLDELEVTTDSLQFIKPAMLQRNAEIIVAPHKLADIEELFELHGIKSEVITRNLQKFIDREQPRILSGGFGWKAYYRLETIYQWLDEQIQQYPRLLTNLTVGQSYQGRTIRAVKLSHKQGNPTIFIESTIHAREWVTVATATYFLNELLTSKVPAIVDLAQNYDWVIIPVFNVDGYAYTHNRNRMWRKNRQPHSQLCFGADPNRNFDANFGVAGTSDSPCSEIYRGPHPFSEPETLALSQFMGNFTNVGLYISFHSYGQYLMFPHGHTSDLAPNHADMMSIGQKTIEAIQRRYNTTYLVGPIATTIYPASGGSIDWVYDATRTNITFVFEFRDHRNGPFGFLLPADQIIPNSEEVIDGIVVLVAEAKKLNYLN